MGLIHIFHKHVKRLSDDLQKREDQKFWAQRENELNENKKILDELKAMEAGAWDNLPRLIELLEYKSFDDFKKDFERHTGTNFDDWAGQASGRKKKALILSLEMQAAMKTIQMDKMRKSIEIGEKVLKRDKPPRP